MDGALLTAIREHAAQEYPRESCGLLVQVQGVVSYVPCANLAPGADHFLLSPQDHVEAEASGKVIAVVHSHPNASVEPSQADLEQIEAWGMPWWIVAMPSGEVKEHRPSGYHPPLLGRIFEHTTLDCFALIRDYYLEVLGIELPDFPREDDWWDKGQSLYLDGYAKAGFVDVTGQELRPHDVVLMQIRSPVPNHGGIYLGNDLILQHLPRRLSRRDPYSGGWASLAKLVVRHHSLA